MKAIFILLIGCGLIFVNPVFAKSGGGGQDDMAQGGNANKVSNQKKATDTEDEVRKYRYGGKDDERERQREMEQEQERERLREQEKLHQKDEAGGQEKQREMKMEQEQKELGKGSEQGQKSREKRKKWWKFWGGDEE